MTNDIWQYSGDSDWTGMRITGYRVEATDGHIGKIDEASTDVGAHYVVVDTGPWIFGSKVMLPAGVITRVDTGDETVYVSRTKQDIKNAPEFDPDEYREDSYRDKLGGYYGPGTGTPGSGI